MESTRKTEIRVGIVTLLALVLLIGGILLGEGFQFGAADKTLRIHLDNSGGLTRSSPVVVNGVKRGTVLDVRPDTNGVIVEVQVDSYDDFHPDASALVTILEITGGKKVEILPGSAAGRFDPSKTIYGRAAADIGSLVTLVGDVSGDLVTLLRRIDTVTAALSLVMADPEFAPNVKSMVADGAALMSSTRQWVEQNRGELTATISDIRVLVADVKSAVKANDPKLRSTLDKLDARLTEVQQTIARADTAIVHVDEMILTSRQMLDDIKHNDGLANALLYDPTFRKKVDTLAARLRYFVEKASVNGINVNVGIGHK